MDNVPEAVPVLISGFALVFGIFNFAFLYNTGVRAKKRDVALELLYFWNSDKMQENRTFTWERIEKLGQNQKVLWSQLKADNEWMKFGAINHFISDFNILIDQKLIDEDLAFHLFGDDACVHLKRYKEKIEYDDADSKTMYDNRMMPLLLKLEDREAGRWFDKFRLFGKK